MRLLEKEQETQEDVGVTRADQENINKFSKYSSRNDELLDSLSKLKEEKEGLEDGVTEMELMDEDEIVMYKIGDGLLPLAVSSAIERCQSQIDRLSREMESLQERSEECVREMTVLKKVLYSKFGKSINLEKDLV